MVAVLAVGCSSDSKPSSPYGATAVNVGDPMTLLGWNITVSNLRWDADYVLFDVEAAPTDPSGPPKITPADLRFGLYGNIAHPIEATGLGSCAGATTLAIRPLAVKPDKLTGTVCLGPLKEQTAARGVYVYSPKDRMAGTAAAYPVAFPVGLMPTKRSDTGLEITTTSVEAWRGDGQMVTQETLGDPNAFDGNGYMLLGVRVSAIAAQYRDDAAARGGPMMLAITPTMPSGQDLSKACAAYGSSVLLLPDATLDAVRVDASLCSQGEINDALLYATLAAVGTHAGVWIDRE